MDPKEVIIAVSAGLIALIGTIVVGFRSVVMAYFDRWVDKIKRQRYTHGLNMLAEFLYAFDELCSLKSVERYMLLEGKDSGGLPEPGKPYTVRCLRGQSKVAEKPNPFSLYSFDISVDSHYCEMLKRIVQDGQITLNSKEMPDGLLKGYYEAEGVSQAVICYVGIVEARLIFVSLAKYQGGFSKADNIAIGLGLSKLRSKLAV